MFGFGIDDLYQPEFEYRFISHRNPTPEVNILCADGWRVVSWEPETVVVYEETLDYNGIVRKPFVENWWHVVLQRKVENDTDSK